MATEYWTNVKGLNDPADYYGGKKDPRITRYGVLSRALSDRSGYLESVDFSWVASDTDRRIRGLLDGLTTKYFRNSLVVVRMIDDESRRLLLTPRTVLRGYVTDYRPAGKLLFEFKAQDLLTSRFASVGNQPQLVPKRRIGFADFADCPLGTIGKGVPIIYGQVVDSIGDTTAGGGGTDSGPVLTPLGGVPGNYFPYGLGLIGPEMGGPGAISLDAQHRSFGVLPGTVPGAPTVTALAGGTLPSSRNDTWSVMITAVHGGVESDPSPLGQVVLNFAAGERSLRATWAGASGGADGGYNIYVANNPFGVNQAMSTYFTPFHVASDYVYVFHVGSGVTTLDVTASGPDYSFERAYVYAIRAVLPDLTESPASGEIIALSHPYRRPVHLRWLPYASAIGYKIYRRPYSGTTPGNYDTIFTTTATGQTGLQTIDGIVQLEYVDPLDGTGETVGLTPPPPGGQVQPIYVGTEVISGVRWSRFLVAGHACKLIGNIYQNGLRIPDAVYGVSILSPGKTGWPFAQVYRDINGRRYTIFYAKDNYATEAIDGSKPFHLNVEGIETSGIGTGTLIESAARIYRHALENWIIGDYQSGSWLPTPVYDDDPTIEQIDVASFTNCEQISINRVGGAGYLGAGIIGPDGELKTVKEILAAFNVSWHMDGGFDRRTRYFVSMVDDRLTAFENNVGVSDVLDIYSETFSVRDDVASHATVVPIYFKKDYSGRTPRGWFESADLADAPSIVNYTRGGVSGRIVGQNVEMPFTRDLITGSNVGAWNLMLRKDPPRIVAGSTGIQGYNIDLGQVIRITHYEGVGAQGYTRQPMRVIRHEGEVETYRVNLEFLDLNKVFSQTGFMGDRATLPAAWTSASGAQRNYFYLGDRTTGLMSDGAQARRLR